MKGIFPDNKYFEKDKKLNQTCISIVYDNTISTNNFLFKEKTVKILFLAHQLVQNADAIKTANT